MTARPRAILHLGSLRMRLVRRFRAPDGAADESDRLAALRAEAERLSAELLAEPEPNYPVDEDAIAELEEAFRARHGRGASLS